MSTPRWDTVAVIGAGLIGGSVGLALLTRGLAKRVVGIGRRESSLAKARKAGTVTETTTSIAEGVARAEVIVVCTPVEMVAGHVREAAAACPSGALITDAGSTKEAIARELGDLSSGKDNTPVFVAAHPMAGNDQTGPENALADLFVDRNVIITPDSATPQDRVGQAEEFWAATGAKTVIMTPEAHDALVARISHLPHLVASALAAVLDEGELPLTSTGWRDTTRIAAGNVELWRQILSENRTNALRSVKQFETVLAQFRTALERDDQETIVRLLTSGKQNRDAVGN